MSQTLLELVQQAAGEISSDVADPNQVAGSGDRTVLQMFRLANRVGRDLVRAYEWRRLVTEYTFATVNGTAEYDLPADFDRMVPDTHYDRTNDWRNLGPTTSQEWQWLNTGLSTVTQLRWRLYLNKIKFYQTPTTAYTMAYEYVSKNWVIATGDTTATKSAFSVDTDICVFPDDLMTLGLIYRWYRVKGLDYADAQIEYLNALSTCKAQDIPEGRKILSPMPQTAQIIPEGNWTL
jgi:hypothetical protein